MRYPGLPAAGSVHMNALGFDELAHDAAFLGDGLGCLRWRGADRIQPGILYQLPQLR